MSRGEPDKEMELVKLVAGNFLRHEKQLNKLFEADAEILDARDLAADYLVFKVDGLHEELSEKLYEDPWLIGWMAVTVTVSDLAAVGAEPFGMLLSLQLSQESDAAWMAGFQQGVNEACATYNVRVLGGDTNFGKTTSVSTTGIGTIFQTKPMLRKQMVPGDLLYATAKLGIGNAFAYARFFDPTVKVSYKPTARLHESKVVLAFATACIDTSDGLFPALSVLSSLNGLGVRLDPPVQDFLCHTTHATCKTAGIPAWAFLAGPHGEYELLFTIPLPVQKEFEAACASQGFQPVLLGRIIQEEVIEFTSEETTVTCAPSEIANLYSEAAGDRALYLEMLLSKHKQWTAPKIASYADERE